MVQPKSNPDNKLVGMKDICRYLKISESTALAWKREYAMPIRKIKGIWVTTRPRLDTWFAAYCAGEE